MIRRFTQISLLASMHLSSQFHVEGQDMQLLPSTNPPTGGSIVISNSDPVTNGQSGGLIQNGGVTTIYADSVDIYPEIGNVTDLLVAPGSSFVLDLTLQTASELPAVHSFSVGYADEPDLTLSSITSGLPPGWSASAATNSFSGVNASGQDLASSEVLLAKLTYSVSRDAQIGSVLALPDPRNFSFLDSSGNSINTWGIFIIPGYGATVVAAPEPRSAIFAFVSFLLLVALRRGSFRKRSQLTST